MYFTITSVDYYFYDEPIIDNEKNKSDQAYKFTMLQSIYEIIDQGRYLRRVYLDNTDPDTNFKIIDSEKQIFQANAIYFGKAYDLLDISVYKKFNLDILKNPNIMDLASKYGLVNVLDYVYKLAKESNTKLNYTSDALFDASRKKHLHVLNKWLEFHVTDGLELKYSQQIIINASVNFDNDVLEWWWKASKQSEKIKFDISLRAFDFRLYHGKKCDIYDQEYKYDSKYIDTLKLWDEILC